MTLSQRMAIIVAVPLLVVLAYTAVSIGTVASIFAPGADTLSDEQRSGAIVHLVLSLAALICAIGVPAFIVRKTRREFAEILEVMTRIASEDTTLQVPFTSETNELGDLAAIAQTMRQNIVDRAQAEAMSRDADDARRAQEDAVAQERLLAQQEKDELQRQRELADAAAQARAAEEAQAKLDAERAHADRLAPIIEKLAFALKELADGNLSVRLNEPFGHEFDDLRTDFNRAGERMCESIQEVAGVASGIETRARDLASGAENLSTRSEHQASTLEETAATLNEISASVTSSSEGAARANVAVQETQQSAERARDVARETISAMDEIEASSAKISTIIGVIDEIAFQTNLLALNAGVEAARAGDAGRGFAVVASEVRELALRTAEAAKEVKQLVNESTNHVNGGADLVKQSCETLDNISASVVSVSALIEEIARSTVEQATSIQETNRAIHEMDQITQQNVAMVMGTTNVTHELCADADQLSSWVSTFVLAKRVQNQPSIAAA